MKKYILFFLRIYKDKWIWGSLLSIIYFNFKYLPFRQAIHLPILLRKPKIKFGKNARIIIDTPKACYGMITLGKYEVDLYEDNGIVLDIDGTLVFKGNCSIGNQSKLSVGGASTVTFGNGFQATSALKMVSYQKITFEENVVIGWDNLIFDTDIHQLASHITGEKYPLNDDIFIGKNSWIACKCITLKGTYLPQNSIVSAGSLLNQKYNDEGYNMYAGRPAKIVKRAIVRLY